MKSFYLNYANWYGKAFQINRTVSEITSVLRGQNSPYHCFQLLNNAILSTLYNTTLKETEAKKTYEAYDLFFESLEKTDDRVKVDLELTGIYHRAHQLLFLEGDFEGALVHIEHLLALIPKGDTSMEDELRSMRSLALLSLGKNDSIIDKDIQNITANLESIEPYSRNIEAIQNCADYYIKVHKPEEALSVIKMGLEANEAISGEFSETYIKLRSLSVDA